MTDYTAEIAALYSALANDTLRVRVGDKDTTFHTADEILKRIGILKAAEATAPAIPRYATTLAVFGDEGC